MIEKELVIVGGGPAGLSAAVTASGLGLAPMLVDDNPILGGQLIKQTHKFFGSRSLYCGTRGMDLGGILRDQIATTSSEVLLNATVVGYYLPTASLPPTAYRPEAGTAPRAVGDQPLTVNPSPGHIIGIAQGDRFLKVKAGQIIFATGASENAIAFPGNDLPGVMGAGAIQTMMNVYGVRPGRRVLMVGAGNIGLIVSYQLLQAGIGVAGVVDVLPKIGGYHVHAAKLARLGVPILTSHTVVEALGEKSVEAAVIARVDRSFKVLARTRKRLAVDTICLAVGLTPLVELLDQAGCRMVYVPELGGNVAWHDENLQTSVVGLYIAGDLSGIEEASTAMLEGRLAGAVAAESLRGHSPESEAIRRETREELACIRKGPFGEKACRGKEQLRFCRQPAY